MSNPAPWLPPQLQAPPGLTAKEQEEKLKADFPTVQKGHTAEIPKELEDAYRYAANAVDYWENQKRLVLNQIRAHIGSAQTATVNGIPVVSRRSYKVEEKVIPSHWVDGFWPATGSKASQA
jgi:hypothetical protein